MSKTRYVLTLSVGPVQGFIAAARKTRDLWAGSQLLSDISKSVALALREEEGVELIFPGVGNNANNNNDSNLDDPRFSVANVITCIVECEDAQEPGVLAQKAKKAAHAKWDEFVNATKNKIQACGLWDKIREEFWEKQTDAEDVVEFCAAWTPVKGEDVAQALARAASLLAGRKNCREFAQSSYDGSGVPKSSLDGARESVLAPELVNSEVDSDRNRIYLKAGEQLDAVGLVKRLGVQEGAYDKKCPSLLNIAIRPWLQSAQCNYENVAEFIDRAESLEVFLRGLHKENNHVFDKLLKTLQSVDENGLYVAILLADGDKMGATLAGLNSSEDRREFSRALSRFSSGVEERVRNYDGLCVYAGGDDVLAFLSVDKALDCANDLRLWFREAMARYEATSLSVGVVIFHIHEMLDQALEFAREAEKVAKSPNEGCSEDDERFGNRNGLAVSFYSRGNIATTIRERWSNGEHELEDPLIERLKFWSNAFQDKLPRGFPYDLHELIKSRVYRPGEPTEPEIWTDPEMLKLALRRDVLRIVQQKENVSKDDALFQKIKARVDALQTEKDLARFVDELLVAKEIGAYEELAKKGA